MAAIKQFRTRRAGRRLAHALPSLWVRGLLVAFALLFGTVMTAQAAHLHRLAGQGHFLQMPAAGSPSADAEEHCPLCVAVHPALPAPIHIGPSPVLVDERAPGFEANRGVSASWSFARFGRPPPVRD